CKASRSRRSSAIPTRPGKKAASRTPSAACGASSRATPTSTSCRPAASASPSPPTTIPRANALTSGPRQRSLLLKCCTSSVNPPPGFRLDDDVGKVAGRMLLLQIRMRPAEVGGGRILAGLDDAATDGAGAGEVVEQRFAVAAPDRAGELRQVLGEGTEHL